ncbi:PSME3-interacting protein isoform X1 [Osmia bicornis bicornis]|uniref:PSME3-interacting protein isoform X1 n=1 Tax=Osmia bicornis bicornis TaxID=1437191 RepID=UPI0010F54F30|nr:PSME3-interacting protein isoform X1 [Osmia bicornis bicornis]XP_029038880.1 PSME3-interacting protein isoform X1 [Osmia bicornis bicornis]XP_029038881.1 PSME3-interacting protein isoform X1 [Osmia bicornis bicornis]
MSSGFISEAEIAEQRRIRQEEWERVRTADQPLEAPEEQYDPRSLYERLQEQKNKRDSEYEEAHKLKNMIKGLDDDEVEFLDLVDRTKLEEERKKNLEEEKEMRDFKAAVASLQEKSLNEKLKQELKNPQIVNKNVSSGSSRTSQLKLLAGVVVKRSEKQKQGDITRGVKRKLSPVEENNTPKKEKCEVNEQPVSESLKCDSDMFEDVSLQNKNVVSLGSGMKCIGILPGLGSYEDSSDSDCSSDTDQDPEPNHSKYDLLGRKIEVSKDKETS